MAIPALISPRACPVLDIFPLPIENLEVFKGFNMRLDSSA